MVGCAAAPSTAAPTAEPTALTSPRADLAGVLAGKVGRYASLPVTIQPSVKAGFSYANCPGEIQMDSTLTPADPEYLWTLAHEWGHIVGCAGSGSNFYPLPPGFPASLAPAGWQWSASSVWKFEQFADCVALYVTGDDRSSMRDYPECSDVQLAWIRDFLTGTTAE